jgi:hypothetical protein
MDARSVRHAVVRPVPDSYDRCIRMNREKIDARAVEMVTVSMIQFVNGKAVEGQTVPRVTGQNRLIDRAFYR